MDLVDRNAFFNDIYLPLKDINISPLDRGFLFGDSVYEGIPVYHQTALGGREHYQRLISSLNQIGIISPYSVDEWEEKMQPLFTKDMPATLLYIQVTRGVELTRKHRPSTDTKPTVLAFTMPFSIPITKNYLGGHAHLQKDLRWQCCDIKSTSLIGNIIPYYNLLQQGVENDDALLVRNGLVVEAPSSNVFIVCDNVIITPPLDNILVGITRQMVIEDAKNLGLPIVEAPITLDMLNQADEVWLTNSYEELKPLVKIDGKNVGNGSVGSTWRKLFLAYQKRKPLNNIN